MSGRHLKQLIQAHRDGDELGFRRTVQEIVEEEEAKHHVKLARELSQLMTAGSSTPVGDWTPQPVSPRTVDGDAELLNLSSPKRLLSSLALEADVRSQLTDLIREVMSWPLLDSNGIPRRQTVLLHGPPGCGKSSAAAALAGELGYQLGTVRIDGVVSSYLGETASNVRRVFEFAQDNPIVLLLDEFDVLGRERGDPNDHGELRRIVNAVLQLMESYRGSSLIVATTNHSGDLDPAAWRRFDLVLQLSPPSVQQLEAVLVNVLGGARAKEVDLHAAALSLEGLPHAAAESAAWEARRIAVLDGRDCILPLDLGAAIGSVRSRRWD